jgi:hypothetical protein
MERSSILALQQPRWEKVVGTDLEVELVPVEMPDMSMFTIMGSMPADSEKMLCQRAFINFKNYTNGKGKDVENKLESRLELYRIPAIRVRINNLLQKANNEVITGEGSAASD